MTDKFRGIAYPAFGTPAFGGIQQRQPDSFSDAFTDRSLLWAFRKGAGEATDRLLGTATPAMNSARVDAFSMLGFDDFPASKTLDYKGIFRLSDQHIPWKELSRERFFSQARLNVCDSLEAVRTTGGSAFFQGVTPTNYLKETVWGENIRPVRELFTTTANRFSNLAATAGLAFMGWHVLSNTRQAYRNHQAREDGSLACKMKTWAATAIAFLGQTVKNLVCWEVASIGLTLGKALIPIGAFPIGGILLGALMATTAYTLLSRCLPDPPKMQTN